MSKKDILCEESIKTLLGSSVFKVCVLDETDSTNTYVKNLAELGEDEGLVVIAKTQTMGRGRMGRKFYSPDSSGLYMSILLKPKFPAKDSLFITTAAAVSLCRALEKYTDKKMEIKWVNDIFCEGRKVCGILTEGKLSPDSSKFSYAVLGIGVNVYLPEGGFVDEIKDIAGFVFQHEQKNMKNKLAASIISEFFKLYKGNDRLSVLDEYKKRSCVLGKKIFVIEGETKTEALALDIDENFNLLVKYSDGRLKTLNSGEVSIKKA